MALDAVHQRPDRHRRPRARPSLRERDTRRPGRFDLVGAVTATLGAVAIVWAFIGTPEHGWLSVRTIGGLVVGLALIAVLARTELRHPHPLIQPHLVRNRPRVAALVTMALVIGANLSMFFLVVQYDERVLGDGSARDRRGLPALQPGGLRDVPDHAVADQLDGRAHDDHDRLGRAGRRLPLAQPDHAADSYFGAVFGPVLIAGLATGFIFMPITTTVLGGVEPEHAGSASGLLQTTQQLGSAVGVAAIVSVYATGAVPGQFVPGVEAAFLTSGAFSLAAFVVAAVGLRSPRRRSRSSRSSSRSSSRPPDQAPRLASKLASPLATGAPPRLRRVGASSLGNYTVL